MIDVCASKYVASATQVPAVFVLWLLGVMSLMRTHQRFSLNPKIFYKEANRHCGKNDLMQFLSSAIKGNNEHTHQLPTAVDTA